MEVSAMRKNSTRKGAREGGQRGCSLTWGGQGKKWRATVVSRAEPCMEGGKRRCSVHLRSVRRSVLLELKWTARPQGQVEKTFFYFCSEHFGSHWRTSNRGRSWSGCWVGKRPQGPSTSRETTQEVIATVQVSENVAWVGAVGRWWWEVVGFWLCVEGKAHRIC